MGILVNFQELGNYTVPEQTDTYVPVSHQQLVNTVKRIGSDHFNQEPIDGSFEVNRTGDQFFGSLSWQGDGESNLSIGFRNSYNKSLSVGLCVGAEIVVCSNLMFAGDVVKMRKHTGNVIDDLETLVTDLVQHADGSYHEIIQDTILMQNFELSDTMVGDFLGQMFVNEQILNGSQIKKAKDEWFHSHTFKERTLWSAYNACTEALKSAHTSHALNKHTDLHKFTEKYYLKAYREHINTASLELEDTERSLMFSLT